MKLTNSPALLAVTLALLLPIALSTGVKNSGAVKSKTLNPSVAKPTSEKLSIKSLEQKVDKQIIPLLLKRNGSTPSLLERAIGMAEGTRDVKGAETSAYKGHRDPMCLHVYCGSDQTNLGSFSYQNLPGKPVAKNPEQADRIQLQILRLQALDLLYQAKRSGISFTLHQLLQGLDLANQAPDAACVKNPDMMIVYKLAAGIDPDGTNTKTVVDKFKENTCRWGYIDRLSQALKVKGLTGDDAIFEARKWSYFEVNRNSHRYMNWSASGLGHSVTKIESDQHRRVDAVRKALTYQIQNPELFDWQRPASK